MDISDLPYPNLSQFEQYGIQRRERTIFIGREFLKFRYHESPIDDTTITKQNYVDEFFELVEEYDTPFQKVYITHSTLVEVIIWIQRQQSEAAAERCLTEALDDELITVHPTNGPVFQSAMRKFLSDSNRDPNFGEYLNYSFMKDFDIKYILTWDSDYLQFGNDVTMLPHRMWNEYQ